MYDSTSTTRCKLRRGDGSKIHMFDASFLFTGDKCELPSKR